MKVISKNITAPHLQNICICGCGAVGSFLALVLSRICNNITLIDPDQFEPHNIATHIISVYAIPPNQQISKVEAVKCTIDSFMPSAIIHSYQLPAEEISHDATVDSTDVFIIATDSIKSRAAIAARLAEFQKPIIDIAISHDGYNITLVKPEEIADYIEFIQKFSERRDSQERACEVQRNIAVIASIIPNLLQVLQSF